MFNFERLGAWNKARFLVGRVYRLTEQFPDDEKYALRNQVRRAVVSVSSNLAEGAGRKSVREQVHFYEIAYGSLMEVMSELILANDLELISNEELADIRPYVEETARVISGLCYSAKKLDTYSV